MQMAAVVKLAVRRMGLDVGHQAGQVHRLYVIKAKFLKTRRIDNGRRASGVHPVKSRARRGVFA